MNTGETEKGTAEEVPKIQPIKRPFNVTAVSVLGLFFLAVFYTFYFARDFFLPVTMALVLSMLLKPAIRFLERLFLPPPVGAAVLLLVLLAFLIGGFSLLSAPASDWVRRIPESFEKVESKVRSMADRANKISKAAETVEKLTETEGQGEVPQVELKRPGVLNSLWSSAKGMVVLTVEVFVLLYFFLAAGEVFTLKLIQILPRLQDKKRAVEIARETEKGISRYLGAMTLVNLFEGTAIGIGLWLIGMPNPLLWGVMAFFANYIPYIGAIVAATIVTAAALISFDSVGYALLAPAIYLGVNFMDNFISPYVMGRRLVLNPVIVFLAVMFWGWLWGIIGVLLAVPITVMFKILCDHIPALAPYGEFLTAPRKPKPERQPANEPTMAQDKS